MSYSNWLRYGYQLTTSIAGDIEIRKSRKDRTCEGMARAAEDGDWIGGVTSWDYIGQPLSYNCIGIHRGDIYFIQSTYEPDLGEIFVRECCANCAIEYGFVKKTR